MVIAGIVAFLVGVVLTGLGLTFVPSSALLLFGMVITGGGAVLLYLAAKSG
jgi:threonine/homoserine/homoserine lactone efflux protein